MNMFFQQAKLSQRDLEMGVRSALILATRYEEIADVLVKETGSCVEADTFYDAAKIARQLITTINTGRLS
jgi:hypothetical protein